MIRGPYAPNSVLVRYRSGTPASLKAQARTVANGQLKKQFRIVPGLEKLAVTDVKAAVTSLNRLPYVEYAEPDYMCSPTETLPNDPQVSALWALTNMRVPAAWDFTTGAHQVVAAMIDTGIDTSHPDLAANIWINADEIPGNAIDDDANGYVDDVHGWDFYDGDNDPMDESNHGTHTAGTLGAVGNNGIGVVGVDWSVQLMPLRFIGPTGGWSSGAIEAIGYAVANGARLSNNSWGGDGYSVALYDAIRNAGLAGHLFVAAAGNNGWDNDTFRSYPSSYDLDNILAVAASTSANELAAFSNYGITTVDLAAPGVSILSTLPNGQYGSVSGTSMATPQVTGVAALLLALHLDWRYRELRQQLWSTTRPSAALSGRVQTGGVVDAYAAVSNTILSPTPTSAPTPTVTPQPLFASLALNESTIYGRVRGRLVDTYAKDGIVEAITERSTGGKPGTRTDRLEHVWEFFVPDRPSIVFRLNAYVSRSADGDAMIFEYSTDRLNYTTMVTVAANLPNSVYQTYQLPSTVGNRSVFVRVRDSNRTPGMGRTDDTIFVDHLEIYSQP